MGGSLVVGLRLFFFLTCKSALFSRYFFCCPGARPSNRPCRGSGRLSRGSRASSTREHPCRRVPGALETLGARSRPGQRRIACKGWRRRTTGCGPRWPGSSPACCTWRRRDPATCRPRLVGRAGRRRGGPPRLAFPTALQCLAWSRSKRCAHRAIAWPCSSHTPAPSQRRARSNY